MKRLIIIIFFSLGFINVKAGQDSIQVSLLTVSPGEMVYEKFGHTALRIKDLKGGYDLVFNYGLFSFDSPNFLYRFVKGETDYQLGATETDYFITDYAMRGSRVTEQVINLNQEEANRLFELLKENYKKENRVYRYNFFFDNCSTRPKDIIIKSIDGNVEYTEIMESPLSFRDLVYEKTGGPNTWLSFGIDLTLGANTDKKVNREEAMFLPEYLMDYFSGAEIIRRDTIEEKQSLVGETRILIEDTQSEKYQNFIFSPIFIFWLLFAIFFAIFLVEIRRSKIFKILDTIVFIIIGLGGVVIYYLNFFSLHPSVDRNFNCFWMQPLDLYPAIMVWVKSGKKILYYYHFVNFVILIMLLIVCTFIPQQFNPAFYPLIMIIALRSFAHLIIGKKAQKKHNYRIEYANVK